MNMQRAIAVVLAALLFTTIGFCVVMGFSLLIGSLGDVLVARVLRWVGGGLAISGLVEVLSLVVLLSLRTIHENDRSSVQPPSTPDQPTNR
jgi:hypothetical protein